MTIEQLYSFLEVYHYKSITKAAKNLGISRQAVSNALKKLESEFNVLLFERSAGGAIPTEAGKELYSHAVIIVKETAAINQNMQTYNSKNEPLRVCKIGLAESLLLVFGEELLSLLMDTFPNIYFDISALTFQRESEYRNYDILVPVLFDSQYQCMFGDVDDDYTVAELEQIPVYVWVAKDSPYNQYEVLDFHILSDARCCTLRNSYNVSNLLKMLGEDQNCHLKSVEEIYLKSNFVDCIEKFGYYAVDFPVVNNRFFYEDLLKEHSVVLKRTVYSLNKSIVYNKTTCENIYPIVVSVLV